jgi:hypothetical protein
MTREDLDKAAVRGCENPHCKHDHHRGEPIVLYPRCHVQSSVHVEYTAGSGVLRVLCATCGEPIVGIAVASEKNVTSN